MSKKCRVCQLENEDEARFCKRCQSRFYGSFGAWLVSSDYPKAYVFDSYKILRNHLFWGLITLLLMCGIGAFIGSTFLPRQVAREVQVTEVRLVTPTPIVGPTPTPGPSPTPSATPTFSVVQPTNTLAIAPTPTPEPLVYYPVSLEPIANWDIDFYLNDIAKQDGFWTVFNIPFDVQKKGFGTQSEGFGGFPTERVLVISPPVEKPKEVHILLVGGWARLEFENEVLGYIELAFDEGTPLIVELKLGENIREGCPGCPGSHVTNITSTYSRQAWQGGQRIVDMLTIPIPVELQDQMLTSIDFTDLSQLNVDNVSPSIHIFGITIVSSSSLEATEG